MEEKALDASISVPKPHVKRDQAGKLLGGETLYAELEEFFDDPTALVPTAVRRSRGDTATRCRRAAPPPPPRLRPAC